MINRVAANLLLRPGLRRDFRDDYKAWEEEYSRFLRVGSMERAELEATTLSGLPRQVALGELEPYTIIDPQFAGKVTYRDTQYGLGFAISDEVQEDDLYGKAKGSTKWLTRSTRLTQEYAAADFLDDAFSGTLHTGYAAEALCSTAHTLLSSTSTWSNNVSGNPQLGVVGLQAAFELGEQTVDHQGDPIPVKIDTLIINIADEWAAIQLTQNMDEPYTTDRNVNDTLKKRKLSYTVSHYKDQSAHDWFARDTQLHDAHFLFKVRPLFHDWYDDSTRASYFASRQRILVYFYDPRGWIGSNAT